MDRDARTPPQLDLLKALGDATHQHPAEFPTFYDMLNSASAGDSIQIEGGITLDGLLDIPDKDLKIFGAYDASYLDTAARTGASLATLDGALREAADRAGVALFSV